ncbi:flippase [Vibrio fluvialis]|nr:flippase [Vibrio fluvialis]GHY39508.1 colanic acid exporter [Vibrio cholerae]
MSDTQQLPPKWLKILPTKFSKRLSSNHSLLAAINNSGWLIFDKSIRLLLGLLVSAWVARYLGPAQFGELAYVLAYLAFFQAVALLGMDGIVVRDIAKKKNEAGEILGTAFILRLTVGFSCWIIAIAGMVWANGWQDRSVYITALAGVSLIFQSADTIDLWFQSQSQSRRTVIAKLVAYLISNGLKILLILNQAPLLAFAVVMSVEFLFAAIALAYAYRKFTCQQPWQLLKSRAGRLLRESWPFILSGLSVLVYMRIDQIMIKEILGEAQLGIYVAAIPLATLGYILPSIIYTSLAPHISRVKLKSEYEYRSALSKIFVSFSVIGWITSIPISILSPFFISLLYGEQYQESSVVLSIYVFTNIFVCHGVALGFWVINENKGKISLIRTFIGALFLVLINLLLIPRLGLVGAAISALSAQALSTIFLNRIFAPHIFKMQMCSLLFIRYKYERVC